MRGHVRTIGWILLAGLLSLAQPTSDADSRGREEELMALFSRAVDKVLLLEGGYVNHPDDPGGETKFGITKRTYPDLDIKTLTREQAIEIYRRDFWNPLYAEIVDQDLADELLETTVVMGVGDGVKCLQRAINRSGGLVTVDGAFGPQTLDIVNRTPAKALLDEFRTEQIIRAVKLAEARPQLKVFVRGWIRRAVA